MEICRICHVGRVRQRLVTYTQWHSGQLVVVPNVLAWVCDYCGDKAIDSNVVEVLQRLLWADVQPRPQRSGRVIGQTPAEGMADARKVTR